MGLSPLVRLDEEVDPRKTRVYAVEPQEGNQEQGTTEEIDTSVNEGNGHQQEKEKSPESMVSQNSDAIETTESSSVSETSPETEAAESFAMVAENDSSQSEKQEQEPQKVVRRRRRRSSAR